MEQVLNRIANYLHVIAVLGLFVKIWYTSNCSGVSGKTQLLYVLTCSTRYLDLFVAFTTLEEAAIRIAFILLGYLTLMSIYVFFKDTREREHDAFRIELIVLPCLIAAVYINNTKEDATFIDVSRNFSFYLEAFAIIPQMQLISRAGKVHSFVLYYIVALTIYKVLKNLHHLEYDYDDVSIACGFVQVLFYCHFFVQMLPFFSKAAGMERLTDQQQVATIDTTVVIKRDSDVGAGRNNEVPPVVFFAEMLNSSNGVEEVEKY